MLICHCILAGTQACKNCSRYKEYFGEQINNTITFRDKRPKGKEEKLIEDIITVIRQEKYIYEHVHLYRAIKELVERYQEELGGKE